MQAASRVCPRSLFWSSTRQPSNEDNFRPAKVLPFHPAALLADCREAICNRQCRRANIVFGIPLFQRSVSPTLAPPSIYRRPRKGAATLCEAACPILLSGFCSGQLPAIHGASGVEIYSTVQPPAPALPPLFFRVFLVFQVSTNPIPMHSSPSINPAHFEKKKPPIQPADRRTGKVLRYLPSLLLRALSSLRESLFYRVLIS